MEDSWLGWDWEAVGAVVAGFALLLAVWGATSGRRQQLKQRKLQTGSLVTVTYSMDPQNLRAYWLVRNDSLGAIIGIQTNGALTSQVDGEVEQFIGSHGALGPGENQYIDIPHETEFHDNPWLSFIDANSARWRIDAQANKLERVTPEDDTLWQRSVRLLRSSWTSLRGFFEKRHLTILEVFLLLTIVFLVIHNAQLVN